MNIDRDVYLAHYGVKGMRWGIRKDRTGVSTKSATKNLDGSEISPKLKKAIEESSQTLTREQRRRIKESEKKFERKFEGSEDPDPKGWRPTGKQVALAAAGAVVAGAVIYKLTTGKGVDLSVATGAFSVDDYKSVIRDVGTPDWVTNLNGKKMSVADFKGIVDHSKGRVWSDDYITKDLFDIPERSFSAGHQFFRVSHRAEESFKPTTFAVASLDDASRYFMGWKQEKANLIKFKATDEVKVPNLYTTLEAMRVAMTSEGKTPTPKEVVRQVSLLAGTDWGYAQGPAGEKALSVLKSWGYGAVVDYMDVGVFGDLPLVLFDSSRLSPKETTPRDKVDTEALLATLKNVQKRR